MAVSIYNSDLITDANLVNYYRLNGNANDYTGAANGTGMAMTYSSTPNPFQSWEGSEVGNFTANTGGSGATSNILALYSAPATGASNFTWYCWIYMTALTTGSVAMDILENEANGASGRPSMNLYYDGNGHFVATGENTSASSFTATTSGITPAINTWYQLALTGSSGTWTLYVNGVSRASVGSVNGTLNPGNGAIGSRWNSTYGDGNSFEGYICDVAMFSRALAQSEVQALYGSGPFTTLNVSIVDDDHALTELVTIDEEPKFVVIENEEDTISDTDVVAMGTPFPFIPYIGNIATAATGGSGSITVNNPGVNPGDLMIAFTGAQSNGDSTSAPSGWTQILDAPGGFSLGSLTLYYKIATASEASSYTFHTHSNQSNIGSGAYIAQILNANTANPINVYGAGSNARTVATLTPTVTNTLLMFFAATPTEGEGSGLSVATASNNPANWLQQALTIDLNDGNYTQLFMSYGVYNPTSATGTITGTFGNSGFVSPSVGAIFIAGGFGAQVSDLSSLTESIQTSVSGIISVSDTINDTDHASVQLILDIVVSDLSQVQEVVFTPFNPDVQDVINDTDVVTVFIPFLTAVVSDLIHSSEFITTDSQIFSGTFPGYAARGVGGPMTPRGLGKFAE